MIESDIKYNYSGFMTNAASVIAFFLRKVIKLACQIKATFLLRHSVIFYSKHLLHLKLRLGSW